MPVKRKHKKRPYKQSVAMNLFLFFLSVTALIGSALLFNHAVKSPGIPLRLSPYSKASMRPSRMLGQKEIVQPAPSPTRGSTQETRQMGNYKYSFYDILAQEHISSASNNYCIQIAALKTRASARSLVERLRKMHLSVTTRKQGRWYLVQWGSFPTKKAAERYKKELSEFLKRECIVVRIP